MAELPPNIRVFIAVRIPDRVRARLANVQQQLRRELGDASWTRPEAMHLTLQFLGDIQSSRLPELQSALLTSARGPVPFELALGPFGHFANRVLWIGLERGTECLTELTNAVRQVTQSFGGREENRAFNAHVTLARMRRPLQGLGAALGKVALPAFEAWRVTEFALIRSELSPHGSRYTTLA